MIKIISQTKEKIKVNETENATKIEILDNCSLIYFYNELSKKLSFKKFMDIDIKYIFSENHISKKIIYILEKNNRVYNIITNANIEKNSNINEEDYKNTIISEKIHINDNIYETAIKLLPKKNYQIKISIYNKNNTLMDLKIYDKKNNKNFNECKLNKKMALKIAKETIESLLDINNIDKIINLNLIANYLNIITNKDYHKLISDDTISLSKRISTNKNEETIDIILDKTKEKIGEISIYNNAEINYKIHKEYKNKYFNTKILNLTKEYFHKLNFLKTMPLSAQNKETTKAKVYKKNSL